MGEDRGLLKLIRQMRPSHSEHSELLHLLAEKELVDQGRHAALQAQLAQITDMLKSRGAESTSDAILPILDDRTQNVQTFLRDILALTRIAELRSRTLEHQTSLSMFGIAHVIDVLHKWYVETAPRNPAYINNKAIRETEKVTLHTSHPVASDSNDYLTPESTAEGVGRPTHYVRHCIDVLGPNMRTLDVGTGGAGVVYEFLMNDVLALGLDGSDYCLRNNIGYWPLLPHGLRTADVTRPFRFELAGTPLRFDLISAWEVLEHIPEQNLDGLFKNVAEHLPEDGYFIGSVSLLEYNDPNGKPYHVTIKPREWWRERMSSSGLEMLDNHPFNARLFFRGNGPRFQDVHNYFLKPDAGFHFVCRKISGAG